jgi:putative two-component system response regulator
MEASRSVLKMPEPRQDTIAFPTERAEMTSGRILAVDDEPNICRLLDRYLTRLGYEVETAMTVPEAVGLLAERHFDLVITDLRLPGPTGLDLLVEVRSRSPGTRMILMSAHADISAAAAAIDLGIDQLIIKPFELEDIQLRVSDSLARRRAEREAKKERELLEARLRQRETESKIWVLRSAHALAAAVEAKDPYTAGHAIRVTAYAMTIAEIVGGIDLLRFRLAGDLHEVGKIGVPDTVLNKPDRLTVEEYDLVKKHPVIGARILEPLIEDDLVLGVVRSHHERWDGGGYPDGLAGEDIPLPARVLAVADTLDAMSSDRAYRKGLPWDAVVAEIRRHSGSQFDPAIVAAFEEALPTLKSHLAGFRRNPAIFPLERYET